MLVVVDTNVLLRLVHRADPLHPCIRTAVRKLKARGDRLCMFSQNAAEFWSVSTRPASARGGFGLSVAETDRRLRLLHRVFDLYHEVPASYWQWHELVTSLGLVGVQVHDARIVALMLAHGISSLLTFDTADFRRYSAITTLSPHELSETA